MLRHGGSQPLKEEGASHPARRGKNAEAFLKCRKEAAALALTENKLLTGQGIKGTLRARADF